MISQLLRQLVYKSNTSIDDQLKQFSVELCIETSLCFQKFHFISSHRLERFQIRADVVYSTLHKPAT